MFSRILCGTVLLGFAGMAQATISLSASAGTGQVSLSWSYSNETPVTQEVYGIPIPTRAAACVSGASAQHAQLHRHRPDRRHHYFLDQEHGQRSGHELQCGFGHALGGGGGGAITGATCSSSGSTTVSATILVTSGTYDGGCRTFNATTALGTGGQEEGQSPVFRVENNALLRNVILGSNGADGVHFYNSGRMENFRWTDVGEDAFTIKSSGTVNITGITGVNAADKFAQVNAASTLNVSNCIVDNAGKFLRQNGGTTFRVTVNVDRCRISNMNEGIFRTDSSSSTARLTNSQLRNSGSLCIGPWSSCTGSGNTSF